ncbi:hypothetical protein EV177_010040, partial [Coemansia sp. RSA 1804]
KSAETTLFTLVTFVFGKLNSITHNAKKPKEPAASSTTDMLGVGASDSNASPTSQLGEVSMTRPSASRMIINRDRTKERDPKTSSDRNPDEAATASTLD